MKLDELKAEVSKYQYLEDTSIIDVSLASIIANRMKLGDRIWLMIIGASSGGKSQILRPLAMTDEKFIHRVDDLTENTFLSGAKSKDEQTSLLLRIGAHGIVVISDFTVIMSKSAESRATILSQLRMVYDGEMTKHSGNSGKPIRWPEEGDGYLGMLAGSTPSIYGHFEEVSDMGERFIYYRMKEMDSMKATRLALSRSLFGHDLDKKLSDLYAQYIKNAVAHAVASGIKPEKVEISQQVQERIIRVASFAERVRTTAKTDWRGESINRIPVPAMPMRVALQMMSIAKGIAIIRYYESGTMEFTPEDLNTIDWLAYSLANEEKRAVLKAIASFGEGRSVTTSNIADIIGLDTGIVRTFLQNLSAVGVVKREGAEGSLIWSFADVEDYRLIRRIERITKDSDAKARVATAEEGEEDTTKADADFDNLASAQF